MSDPVDQGLPPGFPNGRLKKIGFYEIKAMRPEQFRENRQVA